MTAGVTVIVPAYNEEKTIYSIVACVCEFLKNFDYEIIVIDDNSIDGTYEEMVKASRQCPGRIKIIRHSLNLGKGAAIRTGIQRAKKDIIVIQDADMELSPREIPRIIQPIAEGKFDVVFGSRFLRSSPEGMSFLHKFGNKIINLIVFILFHKKTTDVLVGHKAFRASLLKGFNLTSNRFEIEAELTVKVLKKKARLLEVPVSFCPRDAGSSKIGLLDGIKIVWWLFTFFVK
jgi:glycosyltransferase involved in cell wall biosynthesis